MEECDYIIPDYLGFIKGIVDCDDLPLNVSREMLQGHKTLDLIKKHLTKKVIEMFIDLSENKIEEFKTLYEQFGKNIKLGVHEDGDNREKLAKLLRLSTNKRDFISFDDYLDSFVETQDKIYYISGESKEVVENMPFMEFYRKNGIEVFYLLDPIDEYCIQQLKKYNEKEIICISKENVSLPQGILDKEKELKEKYEKDYEGLCKKIKDILLENVEKVVISIYLGSSPCALATSEHG